MASDPSNITFKSPIIEPQETSAPIGHFDLSSDGTVNADGGYNIVGFQTMIPVLGKPTAVSLSGSDFVGLTTKNLPTLVTNLLANHVTADGSIIP